jgi:hypothetical protein
LLAVEALPRPLWEAWLFGSWAMVWIGAAMVTVSTVPYALAVVDEPGRDAVFPVQSAVVALMTFVGSLAAGALPGLLVAWTGGSLAEPGPYRTALLLVPLLFLTCVPVLAGARQAKLIETHAQGVQQVGRPIGLFVVLGAIVFLQNAAEGPVRAFFNVYLDLGLGVPAAVIGVIIGVAQLLPFAAALLTVRLLARWGAALTLTLGSAGMAVAYVPLATIALWGTAALGFMGIMAAAAVNGPARSVFSQEMVAPRWRTTTSAILTIGMALGWASTAAAGGFLIGAAGFQGLFALSACLAAGAAVLAWGYSRASLRARSGTESKACQSQIP